MPEVLEVLVVLVAGLAAAGALRQVARARPGLVVRSHRILTWAVVAASAGGAALAPVAPTGIEALDGVYKAGFAALVTFAAGRARREPRLIAGAIVAIGSAGAWPWNLVAFVALGLATGSAAIRRPGRPLGTVIGALQVQALLRLAWPDVPYATAVLAGLAAGVLVVSGLRHARRHERRPARFLIAGVGALGAVAVAMVAYGLLDVQGDLRAGAQAADAGLDAAKEGRTGDAVAQLARADAKLGAADDGLHGAWMAPGRYLPVVARYLDAGRQVTTAASAVVAPALDSARLADGDALRITDARIDLDAVAALRPPLVRTLQAVPGARVAVDRLDDEYLPGPVASRVRDLDDALDGAVDDGALLLETLDLVPRLLGADGPRRWIIVMQTPSEQRASGGIAGGYGELVIDDGQLDLVRAGEGNELRPGRQDWDLGAVAEQYDRFPRAGPERFFQNLTNVPHFPTVGQAVTAVYGQATGTPVEGVISVDPYVLASLLELTGPIEVASWPEPITADSAARVLLHEQYLRLEQGEGGQLIVDVIRATFDRLRATTLPSPARILDELSPHVQSGRLKLHSPRPPEQALFERMGVAGAMADVDGDYLQVVTLNNSANKIDWYQRRTIAYDVVHDPTTGKVDATATIAITNGAPATGGSELLTGGLRSDPGPPGRSRLTIDVYSALQLQGATVDGRPVRMSGDRAFDRNLYWTTQTLAPGQTIVLEVFLTGLLEAGAPYALDVGMQPVVAPDDVSVAVTPAEGWDVTAASGLDVVDGTAATRLELTGPRRFVVRSDR